MTDLFEAKVYTNLRAGRQRELRGIQAYLYDHTVIVADFPNGRFRDLVLETTAYAFSDAAAQSHANGLANYQAGRLQSGGMGTQVHIGGPETFGNALVDAVEGW